MQKSKMPPIISYGQIEKILKGYNPALAWHDGKSFAIEIANCQRDADMKYCGINRKEVPGR